MELIRTIWMLFQDQVLGMKWLNALIGKGLSAAGLDLDGILGGGNKDFCHDIIQYIVLYIDKIALFEYSIFKGE